MAYRLITIALLILLIYITAINPATSRIIFSNRPALSKGIELARYLGKAFLNLLWKIVLLVVRIVRYLVGVLWDWWLVFSDTDAPIEDIRSHEELYLLYKRVEHWSGLPWQVFWGIHAEETNLGSNLGQTPVINVLPDAQKTYFFQICRELQWDPYRVYGSYKGAIGPFQFIPETWVRHGIDANGDGRRDPFNLEDAAFSAANYLLQKGGEQNLSKAIWHYNQDNKYVRRVMRYLRYG